MPLVVFILILEKGIYVTYTLLAVLKAFYRLMDLSIHGKVMIYAEEEI